MTVQSHHHLSQPTKAQMGLQEHFSLTHTIHFQERSKQPLSSWIRKINLLCRRTGSPKYSSWELIGQYVPFLQIFRKALQNCTWYKVQCAMTSFFLNESSTFDLMLQSILGLGFVSLPLSFHLSLPHWKQTLNSLLVWSSVA